MPTIYVCEQKYEKITFLASENYHFYSREILQYIAWACYRNVFTEHYKLIGTLGRPCYFIVAPPGPST